MPYLCGPQGALREGLITLSMRMDLSKLDVESDPVKLYKSSESGGGEGEEEGEEEGRGLPGGDLEGGRVRGRGYCWRCTAVHRLHPEGWT